MNKQRIFLKREHFQTFLDVLHKNDYQTIGPVAKNYAIQFDEIRHASDLPAGITDEQAPGKYRLKKINSPRFFLYTTTTQSAKPFCFSPEETLWQTHREENGLLRFKSKMPSITKKAIIGLRACDLAGLALQDQHFKDDDFYHLRRKSLLVIAVECARSTSTCFCSSTGDGPHVTSGYDILLNEIGTGLIVTSGSKSGRDILEKLPQQPVTEHDLNEALQLTEQASIQNRQLPSTNLKQQLYSKFEHPQWEDAAQRCLACGNCTSVCPSCFCHHEYDLPQLTTNEMKHMRAWDSCFSQEHSYIHGMTIRETTANRYRQWLTHKLAGWHEQYGRSGCSGCGRCITWCPVEIDLTDEVNKLLQS